MSWLQRHTHRAMRHLKTGGAELAQQKSEQRHNKLQTRLNIKVDLYTRRLNNPQLIHNGKKPR